MAGAGHLMKDHSGRPAAAPLRDLGQPGARGTAVRGPAGCTHGTQPPPGPPRTDNGAVPDPGAAPAVEDAAEASRAHSPEAPAPRGAARARGLRTARRARPFISRFVCPRRPSRRPSPAARDDAGRCAPPRAPRGSGAGPGAGLWRASAIREHLPRLGLGPEVRGVGLSPLGKAHGAEPRRRRRRSPPSPPPLPENGFAGAVSRTGPWCWPPPSNHASAVWRTCPRQGFVHRLRRRSRRGGWLDLLHVCERSATAVSSPGWAVSGGPAPSQRLAAGLPGLWSRWASARRVRAAGSPWVEARRSRCSLHRAGGPVWVKGIRSLWLKAPVHIPGRTK